MATDERDLLRLLHSTEHTFVERKTVGDSKDWTKTVAAFANSLHASEEGVLFIGATNEGPIETKDTNFDKLSVIGFHQHLTQKQRTPETLISGGER